MTVPQSIQEQIQSLEPSAIIELFQLQLTAAVNGVDTTFYYHAGTNELTADMVFNQITYARIRLRWKGLN
jgi:phage-related protein